MRTEETRKAYKGNADRPIELASQDEFDVSPYVEGLGDFTLDCETPLTIAVQGAWGSGKTSMMNMLQKYLEETGRVETIWFNTWQFSQFNMDAQISLTFLEHLTKELGKVVGDKNGHAQEIGKKVLGVTKGLAAGLVSNYFGDDIGKVTKELVGVDKDEDIADKILHLKNDFQQLINTVAENGKKRVVIFIDDLDRLQPIHAIELLEVLKLFVDCENCIFVLAIDTAVVFQGIRAKYGNISQEKAQSFFDKIIQLPFNMPVANYKLETMISEMFGLDIGSMEKAERNEYINLIRMTTDGNPRSIKRIANYYKLTDKVAVRKGIYDEFEDDETTLCRKIALAFACIELRYPDFYEYLMSRISIETVSNLNYMPLPSKSERAPYQQLKKELTKIHFPVYDDEDDVANDKYARVIMIFIKSCKKLMSQKNEMEQKRKLVSILSLSTLNDIRVSEAAMAAIKTENSAEGAPAPEADGDGGSGNAGGITAQINSLILNCQVDEAYALLEKQGVYPSISLQQWTNLAAGDSADRLKERVAGRKENIDSQPLARLIRETLTDTSYELSEARVDKFKILIKEQPIFTIGLNNYGRACGLLTLQYNTKIIKSGTAALTKLAELVEKERTLYRELAVRYGRVLIPEEVFDEKVYEVRDGDELEGFYKAATGDDSSMELPLASVEMCEAFTDFALNSQEDIRAAIQAAEAETAKLTQSDKLGLLLNAANRANIR